MSLAEDLEKIYEVKRAFYQLLMLKGINDLDFTKYPEYFGALINIDAPTTDSPATDEPTTDVPTTSEPITDTPTTDAPTTDTPTTDAPTTDTPTVGDDEYIVVMQDPNIGLRDIISGNGINPDDYYDDPIGTINACGTIPEIGLKLALLPQLTACVYGDDGNGIFVNDEVTKMNTINDYITVAEDRGMFYANNSELYFGQGDGTGVALYIKSWEYKYDLGGYTYPTDLQNVDWNTDNWSQYDDYFFPMVFIYKKSDALRLAEKDIQTAHPYCSIGSTGWENDEPVVFIDFYDTDGNIFYPDMHENDQAQDFGIYVYPTDDTYIIGWRIDGNKITIRNHENHDVEVAIEFPHNNFGEKAWYYMTIPPYDVNTVTLPQGTEMYEWSTLSANDPPKEYMPTDGSHYLSVNVYAIEFKKLCTTDQYCNINYRLNDNLSFIGINSGSINFPWRGDCTQDNPNEYDDYYAYKKTTNNVVSYVIEFKEKVYLTTIQRWAYYDTMTGSDVDKRPQVAYTRNFEL